MRKKAINKVFVIKLDVYSSRAGSQMVHGTLQQADLSMHSEEGQPVFTVK